MTPYILLTVFAGGIGYFLCEHKKSRRRDELFLLLIAAVMIIMAALRGPTVGLDYEYVYKDYFLTAAQKDFSFLLSAENLYRTEPGYGLLNLAVAMFTDNPLVLAATASALIIALRLVCIYRQSSMAWFSVFIYITFGFFGYAMCTLRQELGISVMLFALPYLQQRRIVPYMLIIALAATFHTSLWLMVPVYFIAALPLNKITISLYSAGTVFVLLFSEPIIQFFIKLVPKYQAYAPDSYFMQGRDFNTLFIPAIIFIVVCCMYQRILKRNAANIVLINFYTFATILFVLTMKHFIFQRVALLFLPVALFLLPEMVQSLLLDENGYAISALASNVRSKAEELRIRKLQKTSIEMYRITLGMLMLAGAVYYLFLLSANRLDLVPYVTIWG